MRTKYDAPDTRPRARHWGDDAACRGDEYTALFYPKSYTGDDFGPIVAEAKAICGGCPVRVDCLTHALDKPEPYGIWGGFIPDERDQLRNEFAEYRRRGREGPHVAA